MPKRRYPKKPVRSVPKVTESVVEKTVFLIETRRARGWPAGFLESFGNIPDDFIAPERPDAVALTVSRPSATIRAVDPPKS